MNEKIDGRKLLSHSHCPITHFPIKTTPYWQNVDVAINYNAGFAIIGDNILFSAIWGQSTPHGIKEYLEYRKKFLIEMDLWENKFIEIKDYQNMGTTHDKSARINFTNFLIAEQERGYLQAFFGCNVPMAYYLFMQVGKHIFNNKIKMEMLRNYATAISEAKDVIVKKSLWSIQGKNKGEFFYQDEDYSLEFKVIEDDIVFNRATGELKEKHIDIFFERFHSFLKKNNLWEKGYYRIVDWTDLNYSSWRTKKLYVEKMLESTKITPCHFSSLYKLNKIMRNIILMASPFLPFKMSYHSSFDECYQKIIKIKEETTSSHKKNRWLKSINRDRDHEELKINERVYTLREIKKYCSELMSWIRTIDWESNDENEFTIPEIEIDNPLFVVFQALSILRMDMEHLLADKERLQSKVFLSSKQASLGEMATGVGHEINNPLTVVTGYTTLFDENLQNMIDSLEQNQEPIDLKLQLYQMKENISKVINATERIQTIVEGLKQHSRFEGAKQNFNIVTVIEESTQFSNLFQKKYPVTMIKELKENVLPIVYGNKNKLQQVVINLINNASSAIEESKRVDGKIVLSLTTVASVARLAGGRETNSNVFVFKIQDNGVGIPKENSDKIFDTFFTTRVEGEGAGLGLSIVYAIVKEMDGAIFVDSVVGQGTTFTVKIPLIPFVSSMNLEGKDGKIS